MRLFSKAPQPPAAEPQSAGSAIVIHPLRPAVPARTDEQPASARMKPRRAGLGPSAAQLAREPLAYPAAPPRLEGAVKRTYLVEPEAGPPERPRVPLNQH